MIKCCIFDFDGVLIDSHDVLNTLFSETAISIGFPITKEEFQRFPGMRFEKRIEVLAKEKGFSVTPEQLKEFSEKGRYEYYTNSSSYVELYPGVIDFFEDLKKNNIKICLGSNGSRHVIEKIMKEKDIIKYFDNIVTYSDVAHPKPAPDMLLVSAEKFNLEPEECVFFDDAIEGLEAGLRAGMKVVAVATTTNKDELKEAHYIIDEIKNINVKKLREFFE